MKNVIGKAGRYRLGWQVSPTQIGRFGGLDDLEIFPVAQRQGLELMWRRVSYFIGMVPRINMPDAAYVQSETTYTTCCLPWRNGRQLRGQHGERTLRGQSFDDLGTLHIVDDLSYAFCCATKHNVAQEIY